MCVFPLSAKAGRLDGQTLANNQSAKGETRLIAKQSQEMGKSIYNTPKHKRLSCNANDVFHDLQLKDMRLIFHSRKTSRPLRFCFNVRHNIESEVSSSSLENVHKEFSYNNFPLFPGIISYSCQIIKSLWLLYSPTFSLVSLSNTDRS